MSADPGVGTTLSDEALLWIVRLHSGTAVKDDWNRHAEWCATSLAHKRAAVEAQALWDSMSHLQVEASSGFIKLERGKKSFSRRQFLLGCAGLGTAVGIGHAVWSSGVVNRMSADYATSTASSRTVELPDGSRVSLNACSAIDVYFEGALRKVVLRTGQAYFEVAADLNRPFEVIAGDVSVTALGTAFDVSLEQADIGVEVAVVEHAVRIKSGLSSSIQIEAGQKVAIDPSGEIGAVVAQDVSITSAWLDGKYVAEGRSLSEVVAALSKWHSGVILITDSSLQSMTINTVLDLKDPLGSLDALEAGLPIRVRHISNYITLISMV